jgi:rubrerythrin
MNSTEIFTTAIKYEEKVRDLYRSADAIVDDERGKAIFRSLAVDEQSHIDFLLYSLEQLKTSGNIDINRLKTTIPTRAQIETNIKQMQAKIPERMLGDIKTVLNSALILEKETSTFYRNACAQAEGEIQKILEKFLEIEERHVDVVQIELDHASNSGIWFNFMEVNLEAE